MDFALGALFNRPHRCFLRCLQALASVLSVEISRVFNLGCCYFVVGPRCFVQRDIVHL